MNSFLAEKQSDYSLRLQDAVKAQLTAITAKTTQLLEMEPLMEKVGLVDRDRKHRWYKFINEIIPALQSLPILNFSILGEESFNKVKVKVEDVINRGRQRDMDFHKLLQRFDKTILKLDTTALLQDLRLAENSWFLKKVMGKGKVAKELKKYLVSKDNICGAFV